MNPSVAACNIAYASLSVRSARLPCRLVILVASVNAPIAYTVGRKRFCTPIDNELAIGVIVPDKYPLITPSRT